MGEYFERRALFWQSPGGWREVTHKIVRSEMRGTLYFVVVQEGVGVEGGGIKFFEVNIIIFSCFLLYFSVQGLSTYIILQIVQSNR